MIDCKYINENLCNHPKVSKLDDKQKTCLMTVSKTIKCTFQENKKSPPRVAG